MLIIKKITIYLVLIMALSQLAAEPARSEDFPTRVQFDNGISVDLYTPEAILGSMTSRNGNGSLVLDVPWIGSYVLIEDIADPSIANKGDGSFHPVSRSFIEAALSGIDMDGSAIDITVKIFILPLPRRFYLTSSTVGTTIFISPGVFEVDEATAAWTVTHEFGHCMHNVFLPDSDATGWDEYSLIRQIPVDPAQTSSLDHASHPHEIFAEDFRYLFGSAESKYGGTIENEELEPPDQVQGLDEFFVSLVGVQVASSDGQVPSADSRLAVSNYPNPFNPSTTIQASWEDPSGRDIDISIYDAEGSLVRDLFRGRVSGTSLSIPWDGRTQTGGTAPSGVYFYRVKSSGEIASGKMILVR
jgi:hypothetical protein